MVGEKEVRAFLKENRRAAAGVLMVVAAGMLAAPAIIVSTAPGGWSSFGIAMSRVTALYAFTFIFMNIFTGALAPYFYAIFKARRQYLMHTIIGGIGFLLALIHGLIVLTQRYYRGYSAVWILGPIMLGLLVVTVWVALDRVRFKSVWRWIHQINYAIFLAAFIKAVLIGSDFKMTGASAQAVKFLFSTYVALASVALIVRLRRYQVQVAARRKAGERESEPPVPETVD
jgi:peptidoglycan/LPS O-acetylase OafA/YrhL